MRRRRTRCPAPPPPTGATVVAVVVEDQAPAATADHEAEWASLRVLVAEALILQDAAEDLLMGLRARPESSIVARPCGRINGRFVELREALPSCGDPEMDRHTRALRQIFDHHVLLLKPSLGFLAGEARSERLPARLGSIEGLGAPARRLESIRSEILSRSPAP